MAAGPHINLLQASAILPDGAAHRLLAKSIAPTIDRLLDCKLRRQKLSRLNAHHSIVRP